MGVALARGTNTDEARARAKLAAGSVKPGCLPVTITSHNLPVWCAGG